MSDGRHFGIIDDAYQRMPIGTSHVVAVIAYVSYFHDFGHSCVCVWFLYAYKNT